MQALYFEQAGHYAQLLKLGDRPAPTPARNEQLVRLLASSINPADIMFIEGRYGIKPVFPQIAGMDGVGLIADDNGPLAKDTLVAFRHPGAWAEYCTVPQSALFPLPEGFPLSKGCQIVLNAGTAWGMLEQVALPQGAWLLLTAGYSSIAKITAQMAQARGINVIACVRKREDVALDTLGVTHTLALDELQGTPDEALLQLTGGHGIDAFLDCVGGPVTSALLKAMAPDGHVIVYGLLSQEPVSYHNTTVLYKNLRIESFRIGRYTENLPDRIATYRTIADVISPEHFRMDASREFALHDFNEALDFSCQGASKGKVIFRL